VEEEMTDESEEFKHFTETLQLKFENNINFLYNLKAF
jgi:hypothetical protein